MADPVTASPSFHWICALFRAGPVNSDVRQEIALSQATIKVYEPAAPTIWIPVSSRSPEGAARAFIPFNGIGGMYTHGFKAAPMRSSFFDALASIQRAYLTGEEKTFQTSKGPENQRRDKWRHGNTTGSPLLGPTLGWVEVPAAKLTQITEEELASEIESSGKKVASSKRCRVNPEAPMFRSVTAEARTFQLQFRIGALEVWGPECAVSGATCLLEAAHIKSVSACKLGNQLGLTDPFNSIILNVALHALLDAGLISFSDEGALLVSKHLGERDRLIYGVADSRQVAFDPRAMEYIRYHREYLYQK